ncbi:MAG: DUF2007 domain-containing protein [Desmonostoc vinosum HA7617-LM4]|nr:DUF2007 domain-containing protein [Desmonostoc vinosum HA7617-LM4]
MSKPQLYTYITSADKFPKYLCIQSPTKNNMVDKFVTLATYTNSIEANLAKQHLETAGIRAFLANESTVDVAWHLTIAVGWIKLQVPESDVDLAISLLTTDVEAETTEQSEFQDDADDDIEKLSWADQTADRAFRAAVIGLILFILPIQIYSLWLLLRLLVSRRRISRNRRVKVIVALILDLVNLFILFSFWGLL